jgi:hypothetical protein
VKASGDRVTPETGDEFLLKLKSRPDVRRSSFRRAHPNPGERHGAAPTDFDSDRNWDV